MPGGADTMRQIERDVYLQIIDPRWRDHLAEMDYLKDGIDLRWTGQDDPLMAWQQEGYSMFGQLMDVIDNDYLRYVLHVEAVQTPAAEPDLDKAVYEAAEDPVPGPARWPSCAARRPGHERPAPDDADGAAAAAGRQRRPAPAAGKAQIKRPNAAGPRRAGADRQEQHEKVGRNDPCWCGSGKKFKFCHGAA